MLRNTAEPYPISIHSLHTEGDLLQLRRPQWICYFNPLPPHGGRQDLRRNPRSPAAFQSTPSTRRETRANSSFCVIVIFQSTPSTRRETCKLLSVPLYRSISIHSLHTEGDACSGSCAGGFVISIHSLHTEGDEGGSREKLPSILFQSTPSTRRETDMQWYLVRIHRHFNPLPPHGGRPVTEKGGP